MPESSQANGLNYTTIKRMNDPERTKKMQAKLKNLILSCGEQIPELNQHYDPEKWDLRVNPKKEY